jgi:voltage-gated potassium channel
MSVFTLTAEDPTLGPRGARAEKILEPFVLVAALLTIPMIALQETQASGTLGTIASILNWATWVPFAVELVVLLALVPDRRRFLRRHPLDPIIVVLSPPVLPAGLQAIRALRMLRLLRLLRLAQVTRQLFSLEGLRYAALLALLTTIAGGAVFKAFEPTQHLSTWDGIYWAITTMTTLGSSFEPSTVGGQVTSVVVLLVGISFVALLTGAVAQRFLAPELTELEAREEQEGETDATAALRQLRQLREQLSTLEFAVERLVQQGESGRK